MVDASKVKRDLPYLCDYGKDIDTWIEDFKGVMEMHDIQDSSRIFVWLKIAVEADLRNVLKSLVTTRNNITRYPNYKEVQSAIEKYMDIKPADKCSVLKNLKIKPNENIKNFNYRYLTLYHRLDRDYQKIISVDDYLNSIKSRIYVHSQILLAECDTLSDAFEVAVRAEKAEKRTIGNNEFLNTSMVFQNNSNCQNSLLEHPLYRGLTEGNRDLDNSIQNAYYVGNADLFSTGRYRQERFNSRNNNNNNNNNQFRNFTCYLCGEPGHKARECNKRNLRNKNKSLNYSQDQNQLMTFGKFNSGFYNENNYNNNGNRMFNNGNNGNNYNINNNNNM